MEDSANNGLDSKTVNKGNDASKDTGSNKDLNSVSAGKEKKSENQVSVSKEGAKNREDKIKKDPESETVSKEGADKVKKDDGIGEEGRNKGEKEKGKPVDNSVSKEGSKSSGKGESTVSSTSKRNDGSSGEDCDSSNKCTDEAKRLVACLRVPGNGMHLQQLSLNLLLNMVLSVIFCNHSNYFYPIYFCKGSFFMYKFFLLICDDDSNRFPYS